jgi:hypothetical protein
MARFILSTASVFFLVRRRLAIGHAMVGLAACLGGFTACADGGERHLTATVGSARLTVVDARYWLIPLETIQSVELDGDRVRAVGMKRGWFGYDFRGRPVESATRQFRASLSQQVTEQWQASSDRGRVALRHMPTSNTVVLELPEGIAQPRLCAWLTTGRQHVVALSAADWKVGPRGYVAVVVLQGEALDSP